MVSKPIVARELLEGRYEAGLTHLEHAQLHPEQLRVEQEIGEIDTTWVVYGTRKRFRGDVIGIPSPELFRRGGDRLAPRHWSFFCNSVPARFSSRRCRR